MQTGSTVIDPAHLHGAANELEAAKWFMLQGYQVYWPQARQGPVDFVVEGPEGLKRVQVKSAYWNIVRGLRYLQCRMMSQGKFQYRASDGKYDLIALVFEEHLWIIDASVVFSSNISVSTRGQPGGTKWDVYKVR